VSGGRKPPPLLVFTGPGTARAAAPWRAAAERRGWRTELRPITRTVPVEIAAGAVDRAPPAWVAVTSPNALPALQRLWQGRPELRLVPHAALGAALGKRLAEAGVEPALVAAGSGIADASALATEIVAASTTGDRVLWPRGERAEDLRDALVGAGRYVQAPIAYRSERSAEFRPPEAAAAVFFASPESAGAWLERSDVPRTTAIAIGPSTHAELAPAYARFVRVVRLAQPRPDDLERVLVELPVG